MSVCLSLETQPSKIRNKNKLAKFYPNGKKHRKNNFQLMPFFRRHKWDATNNECLRCGHERRQKEKQSAS